MMAALPVAREIQAGVCGSWISTAAEFACLRAEWDGLFARANPENVFLSFGWMFTWWKHFGKGRLAVIAVRDSGGGLVAVAPFYISRSSAALGARRLGFLADHHVGSDYLNVLADAGFAEAAVEQIARLLLAHRRDWDYIELRDAADSPLVAALAARLLSGGMSVFEANRQTCRYIPLPHMFEEYQASLSRSLRANCRRRWNTLEREHQGKCLVVSDAAELERQFPTLIALHRMRFAERARKSAFVAPGLPEFHAEAMRVLAAQGLVRLFLLNAEGETIAALYGFSVGRTFQFYQCGMHTGWLKHGTGQMLVGKAIEQAIDGGLTTFDFLRGDESYKAQWTARARENTTLLFFDQRPASAAARWSLGMSTLLRAGLRCFCRRLVRHSGQAR